MRWVILIVIAIILGCSLINKSPSIREVKIPKEVYKDSIIKVTVIVDDDNKDLWLYVSWLKNNIRFNQTYEIKANEEFSFSFDEKLNKGDNISVMIKAFDGKSYSLPKNFNIIVKNSKPRVSVLTPKGNVGNNVIFSFSAYDSDDEDLTYYIKIRGTVNKDIRTNKSILKLNLPNGYYNWVVIVDDGTDNVSSEINYFSIGLDNKAPVLIKPIPNQTWDPAIFNINAFNLNDYFIDPDGDRLSFKAIGNKIITVVITTTGKVSFLQPHGFKGKEFVVFIASDGINNVSSNNITLSVGEVIVKCPGPCCNVSCPPSYRKCSNGTIAICENSCVDGNCTKCIPKCGESLGPVKITYPVWSGGNVINAVPCSNFTIKSYEREIDLRSLNITGNILLKPFRIDCNDAARIVINVPKGYKNVRAYRCRGSCSLKLMRYIKDLYCGNDLFKRYVRDQDIITKDAIPIQIKEVSADTRNEVRSGKVKLEFYGIVANVTVDMPSSLKEPENPNLKILEAIRLRFDKKVKGRVNIKVPYLMLNNILEDNIRLYGYKNKKWYYIGGVINKVDKSVNANVSVEEFLNENNEAIFALISTICVNCFDYSFEKVYEPLIQSKKAVILVHGLASNPGTFQNVVNDFMLTHQPYQVWIFGYPSSKSLSEISEAFSNYLDSYSHYYDDISIVAHSLGGLVVQKALYESYKSDLAYIKKVSKVILVGVPSEGTPIMELYKKLFSYLANKNIPYTIFNLNAEMVNYLASGMIVPRVPGIRYYVIAGTKPYEFTIVLSKIKDLFGGEKNDGVVSVKSAQRVGEGYINERCKNYWEVYNSHTELIDTEIPRRIIGQIIAEEEIEKFDDMGIIGNNNYFELYVDECRDDDVYIILGEKSKEEDKRLGCWCGDGYCGADESLLKCPVDCVKIKKDKLLIVLGFIVISFILFYYFNYFKIISKDVKKIVDYLKSKFDIGVEGYEKEDIKSILIGSGWHNSVVKKAFKIIYGELKQVYNNLRRHIKLLRSKGLRDEEIKSELKKAGWKEEFVEIVMNDKPLKLRFKVKKEETSLRERKFFDFGG